MDSNSWPFNNWIVNEICSIFSGNNEGNSNDDYKYCDESKNPTFINHLLEHNENIKNLIDHEDKDKKVDKKYLLIDKEDTLSSGQQETIIDDYINHMINNTSKKICNVENNILGINKDEKMKQVNKNIQMNIKPSKKKWKRDSGGRLIRN